MNDNEKPAESSGGFGAVLDRPTVRQAELKLIRRAIRNGWNVPQELKQRILERCGIIVECEPDEEIFIKAAKVVLEADKADIARERAENGEPEGGGNTNITIIEQVVVKGVAASVPTVTEQVVESRNGRH